MDIKTISDLAKVIDLCRKKGIESIRIDGDQIELRFSAESIKPKTRRKRGFSGGGTDLPEIQSQLTDEEVLMWSSAGIAEPTGANN